MGTITARRLVWLVVVVTFGGARTGFAQTPSPLQEWQYPGGIILERLFEPQVPEYRVILGAAASVEPLYDGSRAYRVAGGPAINIRYRDIAFLSTGEGLGVNLLRGENYRAGVSVGYDLGRRVSDDATHLHGLGDIDAAATLQIFGDWVISRYFPLVLRVNARRIVRGDDGFVGDVEAYLPLPGSSKRFVMFAGPTYTFADKAHLQTMFGVSARQALSSGYGAFTARGGSNAKGVGFSATWFVTPHWLINADAAENRLLGSASRSPITQRRTQRALALTTAYQW